MDALNSFIQSIGVMAETATMLYNALVDAGLSKDVAVTLTAKLIGEIIKFGESKQKEAEQ